MSIQMNRKKTVPTVLNRAKLRSIRIFIFFFLKYLFNVREEMQYKETCIEISSEGIYVGEGQTHRHRGKKLNPSHKTASEIGSQHIGELVKSVAFTLDIWKASRTNDQSNWEEERIKIIYNYIIPTMSRLKAYYAYRVCFFSPADHGFKIIRRKIYEMSFFLIQLDWPHQSYIFIGAILRRMHPHLFNFTRQQFDSFRILIDDIIHLMKSLNIGGAQRLNRLFPISKCTVRTINWTLTQHSCCIHFMIV